MIKHSLLLILSLLATSPATAGDQDTAIDAIARGDYKKAMELSQKLAAAGSGDALGNIGNMYAFGQGVEKDQAVALEYWRKAAEKHVPSAFNNIAACYMQGTCGVEKDYIEAAKWYRAGAEHRHGISMITLSGLYGIGIGVEQDPVAALAWASLAVTNVHQPELLSIAKKQLSAAMSAVTPEQIEQAKALSPKLIEIIEKNLELYRISH